LQRLRRWDVVDKRNHHAASLAQRIFVHKYFVFGQALARGVLERSTRGSASTGRGKDGSTQHPSRCNPPDTGYRGDQKASASDSAGSAYRGADCLSNPGLFRSL
jgi:hypothetical protein